MARFDIFDNEGGGGYLLDVQSDLLGGLNTRVVVPLLPQSSAPPPAQRLNPVFSIE
ncbi:CcdB family protein, partial [Bacillus cereus group sp. BC232]|uniref:CcdB family protein n=1 Tax=Bacillus cereus group sp. BC232 TaxID=3445338 RepID=UPI003F695EAA